MVKNPTPSKRATEKRPLKISSLSLLFFTFTFFLYSTLPVKLQNVEILSMKKRCE